MYKITEIIKELRESLTENELKRFKSILSVKSVVALIEEWGLLYRTETGKHPTALGRTVGMSEELRTKADTGEQYYQVLYDDNARDCVRRLIFSSYPEMRSVYAADYIKTDFPPIDGSGRAAASQVANLHEMEVVILRCGGAYRTYDEGAVILCDVLGIEPYRNKDNQVGAVIQSEELERNIIPSLQKARINFAINDDRLTIYKAQSSAPSFAELPRMETKIARLGDSVQLIDSENETIKVYLAKEEQFEILPVSRLDGSIAIVPIPIIIRNGYKIITPGSAMSSAILGKRENEKFKCNGESYQIISIRRGIALSD